MKEDTVARIEIDDAGRLLVVPFSETFPYIWREAMEVNWDPDCSALYAPLPRTWTRSRWLAQIFNAARAQGCELRVTHDTTWVGFEPDVEAELRQTALAGEKAR